MSHTQRTSSTASLAHVVAIDARAESGAHDRGSKHARRGAWPLRFATILAAILAFSPEARALCVERDCDPGEIRATDSPLSSARAEPSAHPEPIAPDTAPAGTQTFRVVVGAPVRYQVAISGGPKTASPAVRTPMQTTAVPAPTPLQPIVVRYAGLQRVWVPAHDVWIGHRRVRVRRGWCFAPIFARVL